MCIRDSGEGGEDPFFARIPVAGGFVQEGGTLAPGMPIGTTTIVGDYITQGGTYEVEISSGDGAGLGNDILEVIGGVTLGDSGTLKVSLLDGYVPELGDEFTVLEVTDEVSGTFDAIDDSMATLPGGLGWEVSYNGNGGSAHVNLRVVPEPAATVLMWLGMIAMLRISRRTR